MSEEHEPNDKFTAEDIKWLKDHGFNDVNHHEWWWEKEIDTVAMSVFKRAKKMFSDGYYIMEEPT